ncbi:MAG: M48 family metalloprotease [Candidatus Omnitrophica bacterium]|nr:M48 family metalloprotease [Candidatus Omnitrophota bacterium]
MALQQNTVSSETTSNESQELARSVIREIVIPEIQKEVNEGKNFTALRQVYQSLILSTWFKKNIKQSILSQVYVDHNKVSGINIQDPKEAEQIWAQYVAAFKKGAYNYIKEEPDALTGEIIPRKYFSGGMDFAQKAAKVMTVTQSFPVGMGGGNVAVIRSSLDAVTNDGSKIILNIGASDQTLNVLGMNETPVPVDDIPAGNELDQSSSDPARLKMPTSSPMDIGGNAFRIDGPGAMTPRTDKEGNLALQLLLKHQKDKTLEEIWKERDQVFQKIHYQHLINDGFVPENSSEQANLVYKVFNRMKGAYDRLAQERGKPAFKGKLFIIDSPEVNAFVLPGYHDVYITLGLLRALALYCQKENGEVFSEAAIGGIIFHEMRHIMVETSFEGIDWPNLQGAFRQEVTELKRKAERDADIHGMIGLGLAGYPPEAMLTGIRFLKRFDPTSTSETSLNDHPHPKDRETYLEIYYGRPFDLRGHGADPGIIKNVDSFVNWTYRHSGEEVTQVHSLPDVLKLIRNASSMDKWMEGFRLLKYMKDSQVLGRVVTARQAPVRQAFGRDVYMANVRDFVNDWLDEFSKVKVSNEKLAADLYTANSSPHLLSQRLWRDQHLDEIEVQSSDKVFQEMLKAEEWDRSKAFKTLWETVMSRIGGLRLSLEEKTQLLRKLRIFLRDAEKFVVEHTFSGDSILVLAQPGLERLSEWTNLLQSAREREPQNNSYDDIYNSLVAVPYSVFKRFGRKTIDQEAMAEFGHLSFLHDVFGDVSGEIGTARLERSDSNFYEQDIRLWSLDDEEGRRRLLEALVLSRVGNVNGQYRNDQGKLKREIVKALRDGLNRVREQNPIMQDSTGQEIPADVLNNGFKWLSRAVFKIIFSESVLIENAENRYNDSRNSKLYDGVDPRFLRLLRARGGSFFNSIFMREYGSPQIGAQFQGIPEDRVAEELAGKTKPAINRLEKMIDRVATFEMFNKAGLFVKDPLRELIAKGYIDRHGRILEKFRALNGNVSRFSIDLPARGSLVNHTVSLWVQFREASLRWEDLVSVLERDGIQVPEQNLYKLLRNRDLFREKTMQKRTPEMAGVISRLEEGKDVDADDVAWLNRLLLEENYGTLMPKSRREDIEQTKKMFDVLQGVLTSSDDWPACLSSIENELRSYTLLFRKEILNDALSNVHVEPGVGEGDEYRKNFLVKRIDPQRMFEMLNRIFSHPVDVHEIFMRYLNQFFDHDGDGQWFQAGDQPALLYSMDRDSRRRLKELCEWVMDNKPGHGWYLPENIIKGYVGLRLAEIRDQMQVESGVALEGASRQQLEDLAKRSVNTDTAFEILSRIAPHWQMDFVVQHRESVSLETAEGLVEEKGSVVAAVNRVRTTGKVETLKLPDTVLHGGVLGNKVMLAEIGQLDTAVFRRLFDFNLDQLHSLSQVQRDNNESDKFPSGRVSVRGAAKQGQNLIDSLILVRSLETVQSNRDKVSSDMKAGLVKACIEVARREDGSVDTTEEISLDYEETVARMLESFFSWNVLGKGRLIAFLETVNRCGLIGHSDFTDKVAKNIFQASRYGRQLFGMYVSWMNEIKIETKEDKDSRKERDYLEALVRNFDISGPRGQLLMEYDKDGKTLLRSSRPIEDRLNALLGFLSEGSLFRDGFLDTWERDLVPPMDFPIAYKAWLMKEGIPLGDYRSFRIAAILTPLQWEKLTAKDVNGNSIPLGLSERRAREALRFYRRAINLVWEPQKQLRMGATAIKIYRELNPEASFENELKAVQEFFPLASSERDSELQAILNHHRLGEGFVSFEKVEQVRRLLSDQEGMRYHPEMTKVNAFEDLIMSVATAIGRESRVDFLLWLLDPDTYPQPASLQAIHNLKGFLFEHMPEHVQILPVTLRRKLLERLFLGENGIFSTRETGGTVVSDQLYLRLFEQFFPPRSESELASGRQSFTQKEYDKIKQIFIVALKEYPPARRTEIVLSLLTEFRYVKNMREGQRLGEMLKAMGPIGIKIGQVLSENYTLISSSEVRNDLGSLKSEAGGIDKMVLVDILARSGISLGDVRIGDMKGAASIGVVFEGELRINGEWKKVVFKVIRPNIKRLLAQDLQALHKALQECGVEYSYIETDARDWIDTEADLRNEARNGAIIEEVVARFEQNFPPANSKLSLHVPKIYVGDKTDVIIQELAPGRAADKFSRLLGVDGDIIERLRRMLLYMLFVDGKGHADFHKRNVLIGDKIFPIDFGLIFELKSAQEREGVKQFLKGAILEDADEVWRGVEGILLGEGASAQDGSAQLLADLRDDKVTAIRAIFDKKLDIQQTLLAISRVIGQVRIGQAALFTTVVKTLTTSSWLFPTTVWQGLKTLEVFEGELGLSKEQYWQVFRSQSQVLLKAYQQEAQDMARRTAEKLMDFAKKPGAWLQKNRSAKAMSEELLRNMDAVNEMLAPPKEVQTDVPAKSLPAEIDIPKQTIYARQGDNAKEGVISEFSAILPEEIMESLSRDNNWNEENRQDFQKALNTFLHIKLAMEYFHLPPVSHTKQDDYVLGLLHSKDEYVFVNYRQIIQRDLIITELTRRVMQQELLGQRPYADYLSISDSRVRAFAVNMTDHFLATLTDEEREALRDPTKMMNYEGLPQKFSKRKDIDAPVHARPMLEDIRASYVETVEQRIPWDFEPQVFYKYWKSLGTELVIGKSNVTSSESGCKGEVKKTGFGDRGRFKFEILRSGTGDRVSAVMTEKQYSDFLKTGRLEGVEVRVGRFIINGQSSGTDSAQNPGGIDFNPENMEMMVQGGLGDGQGMRFNIDPALLEQIRNARGFTPVIIDIHSVSSVQKFLGLNDSADKVAVAR